MRISYLMHGIGWGAAGSLLLLLKSLKDYSAEKKFATIDRYNPARKLFLKYTDYYQTYYLPQLKNDQAGGYTKKVLNRIKNGNYDDFIELLLSKQINILYINSTVFTYLFKPIRERTNIKTVIHVREMLTNYDNGEVRDYMIDQLMKYAKGIICISDSEASQFPTIDKVKILPNPFDFSILKNKRSSFRKEYNISEETILIGMAGNFTHNKGHKSFLEMVKIYLRNFNYGNNILFLVLGGSQNQSDLEILL